MLKYYGIVICLLFTCTVASHDDRKLAPPRIRFNNKLNISLAKAVFNYDVQGINHRFDVRHTRDGNKNRDNRHKHIKKHTATRTKDNKKKHRKFFDFITDGIEILYRYKDPDLIQFFLIFNDEIKKYHYRGCKFYELTENLKFRTLIAKNLLLLKDKPAYLLRRYLKAIHNEIEDAKLNINKRVLVDLVNGLYSHDVIPKFDEILKNLEEYRTRTSNMDLVKIIRSGIRSVIFDYYTESDHDARAKIKLSIDEYLEYMSIVHSYKGQNNNTKHNLNKQSHATSKKHIENLNTSKHENLKKALRINNSEAEDKSTITTKKIHKRKLQTKIVKKISKPLDAKHNTKSHKKIETHTVETTTKIKKEKIMMRKTTKGTSVERERGERTTKHIKRQRERKGTQESKTIEHRLPSSHGVSNVTRSTSHNSTQLIIVSPTMSQVFRYEMYLNSNKKNIKEPKLYLKKPEFQVKFPALHLQKDTVHINRRSGQSAGDALIFNDKNMINVRRIFDAGHSIKKGNKRSEFPELPSEDIQQGANIIEARRFLTRKEANSNNEGVNDPIEPKTDTELNKEIENNIDKTNTDDAKSQTSLPDGSSDKKPQRKELLVDLKINFDTIKKIITFPFDAIKNAMSKKTNKKKNVPKTKKNNEKQVQMSNSKHNNNIKNETVTKSTNTSKTNKQITTRSMPKTPIIITNIYRSDIKSTSSKKSDKNTKKNTTTKKHDKSKTKTHTTKAKSKNAAKGKHGHSKSEDKETQGVFVTESILFNDQGVPELRARELPPSIFVLENYDSKNDIENENDIVNYFTFTPAYEVLSSTSKIPSTNHIDPMFNIDPTINLRATNNIDSTKNIDRMQYFKQIMDDYYKIKQQS